MRISTAAPLLLGSVLVLFIQKPLTAGTITLDFETFSDSTSLTTQYPGVTFSNASVVTAGAPASPSSSVIRSRSRRERVLYGYDAVGNRVSMAAPTGHVAYSYDAADQLLKAGETTFTYDGNGSQLTKATSGTTLTYGWDALNRLISVMGGGVYATSI